MSAISEVLTAVQPFVSQVSDAVRSSIEVIGAAIQLLVPQFTAFVGTLDGGNIGKVIGDGIMQGARFLAEIGDYIIQNFSSVFQYLTQIGAQWSAVFDLGSRVASFFGAVGDTLQAVFGVIILGITGPVESLIGAAKTIGDALYLDTSSLDSALAGMEAFNNKITEDISANGKSAYKGFRDALSADAAPVGEAIAGPLTTTLDSAIAHARAAAAKVDEKTQGSVRKVLDTKIHPPNTDALKAIVVGTSEGEAFRNSLLRGADPRNAGAEDEKRTADATEETAAGVDELVVIMRDQFAIAEITV
jgi:phage-related protein